MTSLRFDQWHHRLPTPAHPWCCDTRTRRWAQRRVATGGYSLRPDWTGKALERPSSSPSSGMSRAVIVDPPAPASGVKLIELKFCKSGGHLFGKAVGGGRRELMAHRGAASAPLNIFASFQARRATFRASCPETSITLSPTMRACGTGPDGPSDLADHQ
ncbi:MAG: hypothetical protein U5K56_05205 [Halioglobus sp.]|nr:hypothetical protein [Halioglobus sp.]